MKLLLGFLIVFSQRWGVAGNGEAIRANKTVQAASSCLQLLLPDILSIPRETITEGWLKSNMRFGPEVTFTAPGFEGDQVHAKVNAYTRVVFDHAGLKQALRLNTELSLADIGWIGRFVDNVLNFPPLTIKLIDTPKITKWMKKGSFQGFHVQRLSLFTKDEKTKPIFLTIEPNAIELNQPPQAFPDIRKSWKDVFSRANQSGFAGTFNWASGGGGGHMHLGFKNAETNLFIQYPDLVLSILLLPLLRPEIMTAFYDANGYGILSNARTPFDASNDERIKVSNFFNSAQTILRDPRGTVNDFLAIAEAAPSFLKNHYSYISLKNLLSGNPRLEVRSQRSYQAVEDIEASAEFWLKTVLYLVHNPFEVPGYRFWNQSPHVKTLMEQRQNLLEWMNLIGLSKEAQARVLRFSGDSVFDDSYYKVREASTGKWLRARALFLPDSVQAQRSQFELQMPISVNEGRKIAQIRLEERSHEDVTYFMEERNGELWIAMILPRSHFKPTMNTIHLMDENGNVLKRFRVQANARLEGSPNEDILVDENLDPASPITLVASNFSNELIVSTPSDVKHYKAVWIDNKAVPFQFVFNGSQTVFSLNEDVLKKVPHSEVIKIEIVYQTSHPKFLGSFSFRIKMTERGLAPF